MNNEPVAWMSAVNGETVYVGYEPAEGYLAIPLYTHPLKELKNIVVASATCSCGKVMEVTNLQPAKELTITFDDCIAASLEQDVGYGGDLDLLEFAKAILRKAQEK